MHSYRLVSIVILTLCFLSAGVFSKNVENQRAKRTIENHNCENVKSFFAIRNITSPFGSKGGICGGQCCGDDTETILRKQGQDDFAALLRHNSRSLQGLLNSTATTLHDHVVELSRQSENKTSLLFSQVYKGMAVLSQSPIDSLYNDIRAYILSNTTSRDTVTNPVDIRASVNNFFTDFFPLVYHHILLHNTANRDFAVEYKTCLKKTIETVLPFDDIPRQLAQALAKSLEATRLLLQAFRIGIEVLEATDRLLVDEGDRDDGECHVALLRMAYCPKCMGLDNGVKPCAGYCLNVLRGCLARYVAELDSPWNGYVEGIESLMNAMKKSNPDANANADLAIRSLDTRISEAIMRAMEKGHDIDARVKRYCGPATFLDNPENLAMPETNASTAASTQTSSKPRSANPRVFAPLPETQLLRFHTSIAKSRGFYGNLADTLCQDENFAEPKDQKCWNGERIAEYTKTVVDVGLDMQKYNPEVKPNTDLQNVDPRIAELVDKLRHVHHMAMSSVGSSLPEIDYMQRDGVDGSGSGSGPDFDDGEDENRRSGSGSGDGPTDEEIDHPSIHPSPVDPSLKSPPAQTAGSAILILETFVLMTSLAFCIVIRL